MLTRLRRTAALALKPSSDRRHRRLHAFLDEVDGVIHVGANSGQERWLYDRHHLNVLWIEPLPEMAAQLRKNIGGFPRQIALEYLLCDQDGRALDFYIANNQGQSSSLLELGAHRQVWPRVDYVRQVRIEGRTLDSVVREHEIDLRSYGALVLDVQGAELLVLEGARKTLGACAYVKAPAPNFEAYVGGCRQDELITHLQREGFVEIVRQRTAYKMGVGSCFEQLFRRERPV